MVMHIGFDFEAGAAAGRHFPEPLDFDDRPAVAPAQRPVWPTQPAPGRCAWPQRAGRPGAAASGGRQSGELGALFSRGLQAATGALDLLEIEPLVNAKSEIQAYLDVRAEHGLSEAEIVVFGVLYAAARRCSQPTRWTSPAASARA